MSFSNSPMFINGDLLLKIQRWLSSFGDTNISDFVGLGGYFESLVVTFYCCNCSIYVVIFSIFLGADVSALVPFCPDQFNVTHCLHWYDHFELINDDDDDDDYDDDNGL